MSLSCTSTSIYSDHSKQSTRAIRITPGVQEIELRVQQTRTIRNCTSASCSQSQSVNVEMLRTTDTVRGCLVLLLFAWSGCHAVAQQTNGTATSSTTHTESPYILFTTTFAIYRMNIDGSNKQLLVQNHAGWITAVDYHYRLGYIFWTMWQQPAIHRANLDGSNITVLVNTDLQHPSGMAVDWINDKLYWTDQALHRIEEYDLKTSQRRVILTTGSDSTPTGIAVYPFQDQGRLYWTDKKKNVLETAMVTGNRSVPLRNKLLCPRSLTLEYTSYKLYWADHCAYQIEAMNMKTLDHSIAVHSQSHFSRFARGIVHFYDSLYWTEVSSIFFLNETRGDRVVELYDSRESLTGIQIVHPSRQPTELNATAMCFPPCENGKCVLEGFCLCDRGWTGATCSTLNSSLSSSAIFPVPTATTIPNSTVHYSSTTPTLSKVDPFIVQTTKLDRPTTSKHDTNTARVDHASTSKFDLHIVQFTQVDHSITSKHDPYTVQVDRSTSNLESHIVQFTQVDTTTSKLDSYTVQLTQVGDATTHIEPKPSSAAVLANSPTVHMIDTTTSILHTSFKLTNSFQTETNIPSSTIDLLPGLGSTVSEKGPTTIQSISNTPISPPTVGSVSERDGNTMTLLIAVTIFMGAVLIAVVAVGCAILMFVRNSRKKGSWSPTPCEPVRRRSHKGTHNRHSSARDSFTFISGPSPESAGWISISPTSVNEPNISSCVASGPSPESAGWISISPTSVNEPNISSCVASGPSPESAGWISISPTSVNEPNISSCVASGPSPESAGWISISPTSVNEPNISSCVASGPSPESAGWISVSPTNVNEPNISSCVASGPSPESARWISVSPTSINEPIISNCVAGSSETQSFAIEWEA